MAEFKTVEELAEKFKTHPETIRRYIREGKIKATIIGKKYLIEDEDEKKFIQNCPREYKKTEA